MMKNINITWHEAIITKEDRQKLNNHKSLVVWFTGLSGAGKSTLASEVEKLLHKQRVNTYILDGDNIRHGLNKDLGFQPEDRKENIRRIGEVSRLFVDAGIITLVAFISPYREDRQMVRSLFKEGEFLELYVKCSLTECQNRDPKGLYKKALNGEIKGFTGVDAPYEAPLKADLIVETDKHSIEESVKQIINFLKNKKYIE
ncbi:adenylyl-sulfate kinase [Bacillus cereus]|nr:MULTISPECIES: adenylyl-sulfate kinase [Bacillus]EEL78758.1 Adenylyl-sulfate kinase [Bacillus cereus AH1271]EEL84518.1 Adenylyl-sulfate kinase [Bacillus cereus AH1272]EEL90420.1 Adenylyl-sulfate kinase [Bacillus cereus AH1273]AYY25059.1 adenylyl-sulfate kinase [Bacillus sp. FDAARGOS_527]KXI55623.1 adenylyl-sulfate kinase [Bacillus cereus]